ncbi:TPA: 3'(2'),5'-bisphosphate nucleotidase CysQ [bacterium]|nr:3'(2'),5'-bisphosphate nucleotidase CysQ [bacterium]
MYKAQLEAAKKAAIEAKKIILDIYDSSFDVMIKEDESPVTKADLLADKKISEIILASFPNDMILSEESEDDLTRLNEESIWIVDPLDGTKDFVNRTGDFTINIAYAKKGEPVVGVILYPLGNKIYYAIKHQGAYVLDLNTNEVKQIHVSDKEKDLIVLTSHFHVKNIETEYYQKHQDVIKKIINVGSSLKACLIAEGKGDLQLKIGPGSKEWDVAASHIIVKEAGGVFLKPNGEEFTFNKENVMNERGFLIMNKYHENLLVKEE